MISQAAIDGVHEFGLKWQYSTSVPKRPEDIDLSDLSSLEEWLSYLKAINCALTKSDRLKEIFEDVLEKSLADVIWLQEVAIEEFRDSGEQSTWDDATHFEEEMKCGLHAVYDVADYYRVHIAVRVAQTAHIGYGSR
jgi:hypothetical protein